MRAYARDFEVRPLPARHGVGHAILDVCAPVLGDMAPAVGGNRGLA